MRTRSSRPQASRCSSSLVVADVAGVLLALVLPRFVACATRRSVRAAMADVAGGVFPLARQMRDRPALTVAVVFDTAAGVVQIRSASGPIRRSNLAPSFGVTTFVEPRLGGI